MKFELTKPDKLLWPDAGVTKRGYLEYLDAVSGVMLPLLRHRAINLERMPDGVGGKRFWSQAVPEHFPGWFDRVTVPKRGGSVTHAVVNNRDSLLYLAQQAVITPHAWLSRTDAIHKPDRIIWDLDPSEGGRFADVRAAARDLGDLLRGIGLEPFAMVTGSRGIHVVTPIRRGPHNEDGREFARAVSAVLAENSPRTLTTEFFKEKRGARIFLDTARNTYAQTTVPAYAARARPRAPVAAPLRWAELSDSRLKPDRWTIKTMPRRLDEAGDAWEGFRGSARALGPAAKKL